VLHLPEWTFDRKRISANSNLNSNSNFNPNTKAQLLFGEKNDVIFWASVQIPKIKCIIDNN